MHLLEVILRPFLAAPTDLSFAGLTSAESDDLDSEDGLVVGVGRRKAVSSDIQTGSFAPSISTLIHLCLMTRIQFLKRNDCRSKQAFWMSLVTLMFAIRCG